MEMSQNKPQYAIINPNAAPGFIPALDGLRALSILIVIAAHLGFGGFIPGGFGVTIFFFLSGFLITRLLAGELNQDGKVEIIAFYMRRFLRLYPALLVLVGVIALLSVSVGINILPAHLLSATFYFVNYYDAMVHILDWPKRIAPWGHLWSLAVEEHFYLIFPILLAIFGRKHNGRIALVIIAILLSLSARVWAFNVALFDENYTYSTSECRIESIAWGALLALLIDGFGKAKGDKIRHLNSLVWIFIATSMLVASFIIRDQNMRAVWRYTIQGAALFILIYNLYFNPILGIAVKILDSKPLRFIGRLSYSLYLWHWPIIWYFAQLQGIEAGEEPLVPLYAALALSISFGFAFVSYYCIERPFFSLRKKFGAKIVEEMQK